MNEGTGPSPQIKEVQIWSEGSGLFRTYTVTQGNHHGPHKIIWN